MPIDDKDFLAASNNEQTKHTSQVGVSGGVEDVDITGHVDYFQENRLFINDDLGRQRAENQEWSEQALNGLGRIAAKLPATVMEQLYSMKDAAAIFNPDHKIQGDSFTEALAEYKSSIDDAIPIFQENPGETFSWGDSGWWMENLSGGIESAAAFVISSYLTGGVLGKGFAAAARGPRYIGALAKTRDVNKAARLVSRFTNAESKASGLMGTLGQAATSNHMEGFGVALQVSKEVRDHALAEGKTEQEANKLAADAASTAYNTNRINIAFNISSARAFIGGHGSTRNILKKMTAMNTLKNTGIEGLQEGAEETVNFIAEQKAKTEAKGEDYGADEILTDVFSEEGLESAFWGGLLGMGQTSLTGATNYIPNKIDPATGERTSAININNKQYAAQKKRTDYLDSVGEAVGVGSFTTAMKNVKEQLQHQMDLRKAIQSGNDEEATRLQDLLLGSSAYASFEDGTTDVLEDVFHRIQTSKEKPEGAENDYKERAGKAIQDIRSLEKTYQKSKQFINDKEVYYNQVNKKSADELVVGKQAEYDNNKVILQTAIAREQAVFKRGNDLGIPTISMVPTVDDSGDINTADITINPDNFAVEGNIVPEVKDEVSAKIQSLQEYKDLKQTEEDLDSSIEYARAIGEQHGKITSPEYQEALQEQIKNEKEIQRKAKLAADKKRALSEENKKRSDALNNKKKEDAKDVVVEEGITETLLEGEEEYSLEEHVGGAVNKDQALEVEEGEEDGFTTNKDGEEEMDLEGYLSSTPVETGGKTITPTPTKTQEVVDKENEDKIVEGQIEKEQKLDSEGIYSSEDNTKADLKATEIEKDLKDKDTTTNSRGRIKEAFNKLAYLARPWAYKTNKSESGSMPVKTDVSNELNENFDYDLLNVKVGDKVSVRVLNEDSEKVTHKGKETTWGIMRSQLAEEDIYKHVPMGVFING